MTTLDPTAVAAQFPALDDSVGDMPFTYLDSAATTQKPLAVIERMDRFLRHEYGTVHRGLYRRSAASTEMYEEARAQVARFLGAEEREVVFTMGCTDAINLVARSWGTANLGPGDRVLVTAMEHHSGIVPWQLVCEQTGAELVPIPMQDDGSLNREAYTGLLDERVKFVGLIHVANSLGTINPVADLTAQAHAAGAVVLVDGAQSAPHLPIDVTALDCDFFTCSAHKIYGPTGIGALYGRYEVLAAMPPFRGGGEMIDRVRFTGTTYAAPPSRFEAGTPPIVEAIGFGAACEWLSGLDRAAVIANERDLYAYAEAGLATVPGLRRIGTAPDRCTVLSFVMEGAHPADIAQVLDAQNVAIRAGHHCAQPVMDRFGIPATARISLGVYNTRADIDRAVAALHKAADLFAL